MHRFSVSWEDRTIVHENVRLTAHSRAVLVGRLMVWGQAPASVAAAFGVAIKTVRKWLARFQDEGAPSLVDRSSRPQRPYRATAADRVVKVEALRRQRWTGRQIAADVGISPATVRRILRRLGLDRIAALEPAEPTRRYERERPGERIPIDIKKRGGFDRVGHRITGDRRGQSNSRGIDWEFIPVCVDDAYRAAFSQILPDEKIPGTGAFLRAAVASSARLGVRVARVMTDNGSCYRAFGFRDACRELDLKHMRTRPYTPRTNGKAERFIRTALREWAYAKAIAVRPSARPNCRSGCIDTTGIARTAA